MGVKNLQIRDLPEDVYQRLRQEAEKEHRSITQQAIVAISEGLRIASGGGQERRKRLLSATRLRPTPKWPKSLESPADSIREDRQR